jgi:DNA-binding NarL/FixJ family response regulator
VDRTVVLVDDHPVVRAGVRSVLESIGNHTVVAEAGTVAEAQYRLGVVPAGTHLLIADVQLRGGSALDVIRQAVVRHPRLDVVVLTSVSNALTLRRALVIGARGIVHKASGRTTLVEALNSVAAGHLYLDPRLADAVVSIMLFADDRRLQVDDERLLTLLGAGLTDRDMARVLSRPRATVSRHVAMLLRRLGAANRAAAVAEALRRGLLDGHPDTLESLPACCRSLKDAAAAVL